jgi:hypothetical protein
VKNIRRTAEMTLGAVVGKPVTMQCNAMQCNAMQCNAMQCNAMQCNAIHYITMQYIKKLINNS